MNTRWPSFALLVVAVACRSEDGHVSAQSHFEQWDSAGITIVANNASEARAPSGWIIGTVPNLDIGRFDGDSAYQFHQIGGIKELDDGRLLVVDGGSGELRFYETTGVFTQRSGRKGRGPGEFEAATLIRSFDSESLVVYDQLLRRFTSMAMDGTNPRVSTPAGGWPGSPIGKVGSRILVFLTTLPSSKTAGPHLQSAAYALLDANSGVRDTIGVFPGRMMFRTYELTDGASAILGVPFDIMPSAAVSHDGFFVTPGESAEILNYDGRGRLRQIIRLNEPVRQVTQEEFNTFAHMHAARTASKPEYVDDVEAVYRMMPVPSIMPSFRTLLVDANGMLWAKAYNVDDRAPPIWLIFDPAGRALGTVRTPTGLEVRHIGREHIIGVWRDETGVEYVRRHTLNRTSH